MNTASNNASLTWNKSHIYERRQYPKKSFYAEEVVIYSYPD
jgi:hypothetical protein